MRVMTDVRRQKNEVRRQPPHPRTELRRPQTLPCLTTLVYRQRRPELRSFAGLCKRNFFSPAHVRNVTPDLPLVRKIAPHLGGHNRFIAQRKNGATERFNRLRKIVVGMHARRRTAGPTE